MTSTSLSTNAHRGRFLVQDLVGRTIDKRYAIRELIAQGGTSLIYKAQDNQLGRLVALKIIVAPRAAMSELDKDNVLRLKREGKGLAQMEHPNIVSVFDTGVDQDTLPHYDIYYMAMKLMEGETLEERLKKLEAGGERMAWGQVLAIVRDVTQALDYAHKHEYHFVHRDVKPSNILLVDDRAYLFDFGLLKARSAPIGGTERRTFVEFGEFTQEGAALGTPAYWSPEQITGADVDERADIYALGGVLYRMLTGRLPYEANDVIGISMQHLNAPPPKPSSVDPALFAFDPIVTRTMAKAPGDRYPSAGTLTQALEEALTLTPGPDRSEALLAARDLVSKATRWLGGLLAALVVAALVLFFGVRRFNWFRPATSLPLGWQSSAEGIAMIAEDDNDYLVTVTEGDASYAIFRESELLENPNISFEGELTSGPPETAYGLLFQRVDEANYYVFAVTSLGQIGIWQHKGERWLALTEAEQTWVSRKYVLTDRPNRLEVTIEGGRARGWINNQPVFEIGLDGTRAGHVGFFVSTSKEARDAEATIRFANFTVRK
jgi:tRNA A-37 threonylcarbamoyl transferase component Bud32